MTSSLLIAHRSLYEAARRLRPMLNGTSPSCDGVLLYGRHYPRFLEARQDFYEAVARVEALERRVTDDPPAGGGS